MSKYVLYLRRDYNNRSRVRQGPQRIYTIIIREQRLAIQTQHAEVYNHSFSARHERPAQVDLQVESAVALAFRIELGSGEKRASTEILFEDAHKDDGEGGEERVEHGE